MAMATATTTLIRMPSKSLVRENSILLNHQVRLAEENADLHKDIEYILSILEGTDPSPDTYAPHLNNAGPSNEPWLRGGLQRRYSLSSIYSTLGPDDFSPPSITQRSNELAKHAFKSTAPAVDMPTIPEEVTAVTMRDLHLHLSPEVIAAEAEEFFWSKEASGSGNPLEKKTSIGPILKAWLGSLHEGDEDEYVESSSKAVVAQELPSTPSSDSNQHSFHLPASPEPRPEDVSRIRVPAAFPVPHISLQSPRDSSPNPSNYSADSDEEEDDDDYMPSLSPGKRGRRSNVAGGNSQASHKFSIDSSSKRTRTIPSSSIQLYCLFIGCSNASLPFSNLRDRNRHMETHFPNREHPKCAACGKSMSRSDSVKRHQNSPAGRKCRVALMGKPGSTTPKKPWCNVDPWRAMLRTPPEEDPLYVIANEMQTRARR